ncbi:MAG TPA: YkgJ family cysteine cluster protein [Polyangiaceae bacterium]|nr:YkgJ family cysteine cluster protein [Polyangiaceae bacterium]
MPATEVVRPVVRSFNSRQWRGAAVHARQGGHAVVWEHRTRARLLVPCPIEDDPKDLAYHSILDLGKQRYRVSTRGVTKGLAVTLVPRDCIAIVRDRIARDKVHTGATHTVTLDCVSCAACCYSNRVVLDDADVARFRRGGRGHFAERPYVRHSRGEIVLRLAPDRACVHLAADSRCGIYAIRPEMCRTFPVGSECCLSARAEEYDLYDGARPA